MTELRNGQSLAAVPRTETDSKNRGATCYPKELRRGDIHAGVSCTTTPGS
jgi:hypothetical protein